VISFGDRQRRYHFFPILEMLTPGDTPIPNCCHCGMQQFPRHVGGGFTCNTVKNPMETMHRRPSSSTFGSTSTEKTRNLPLHVDELQRLFDARLLTFVFPEADVSFVVIRTRRLERESSPTCSSISLVRTHSDSFSSPRPKG
jgi:hypothetical protein